MPCNFRRSGWDLWLKSNLEPLIGWTPLIQHSYGIYDEQGKAAPHEFPRDSAMLRPDALIFHRDPKQQLTKVTNRRVTSQPNTFYHSGDLGDIIYHLPVIQRLGSGHLRLGTEMGFNFPSHCREPMTPSRVAILAPLLEAQPYIQSVQHASGGVEPGWTNLNLFREIFRGNSTPTCTSLQRACFRRFGFQPQDETKPWLTVPASRVQASYIAVARSARYHNPQFPWVKLVQLFGAQMRFIGLADEHAAFCSAYGKVPHLTTANLLDVAKAIANSQLFIGNQSCPYAIAEGLKHPAVLECWPHEPNCLFQRANLLNLTTNLDDIHTFAQIYANKT